MKTNSYKKIITTAIGLLTLFGMVFGGWYQAFAAETVVNYSNMSYKRESPDYVSVKGTIKWENLSMGTKPVSETDLKNTFVRLKYYNMSNDRYDIAETFNFTQLSLNIDSFKYNTEYQFGPTKNFFKSVRSMTDHYIEFCYQGADCSKSTVFNMPVTEVNFSLDKNYAEFSKVNDNTVKVTFPVMYTNPIGQTNQLVPANKQGISYSLFFKVGNNPYVALSGYDRKPIADRDDYYYNVSKDVSITIPNLEPNREYWIQFFGYPNRESAKKSFILNQLTTTPPAPAPVPAPGGNGSSGQTPPTTPPAPAPTPTPTPTSISFENNNLTSTSADGKIDTTISMNSITVKGTKVDVVGKITYGKRDETEPLPQLDAGKLTLELLAPVTPPLTSNTVLAIKTIDVVPAPAKLNFDAPYKSYQFTASFDSVQNTASIKSLRITETDLRSPSTNFALTTTSSGVLIPPGSETPEDSETSSEPKKADRPLLSNPLRSDLTTIPGIVNAIVSGIVIPVAIPLLALAIMYTGFLFVIAKGNSEKLKTAKEALKWTVYGGLIILGSYIIAEALQGTLKDILGQ